MPHQFMTIGCKGCETSYCVVCNDACPQCEEKPTLDKETIEIRNKMRRHMSGRHPGH